MAGIGFVLQKLIRKNSLSALFRVVMAGTMIVAGPWLLSIIGITLVTNLSLSSLADSPRLFSLAVIYSYIVSLFLFGGFHYLFSRKVADYVYERNRGAAAYTLVLSSALIGVLSIAVSAALLLGIELSRLSHPWLYAGGFALLFLSVNLTWLLMIFASMLKRYWLIIIMFGSGMMISVGLTVLLSGPFGTGGALMGYAIGQFLLAISFFALCLSNYRPRKVPLKELTKAFSEFAGLFLGGMVFSWAIWADKIVFWFMFGSAVPGSVFLLNDAYDIPVFYANLSIIPGLVFFVISTETNFFSGLKSFLKSIEKSIFSKIQLSKYELIHDTKKRLIEQSLFQLVISFALILVAPGIVMKITLASVSSHLFLLTLITFLFYLQAFQEVLVAAFQFLALNLIGSLVIGFLGLSWAFGLSYLVSATLTSIITYRRLMSILRRYDRIVFVRSSLKLPQLMPVIRAKRRKFPINFFGPDQKHLGGEKGNAKGREIVKPVGKRVSVETLEALPNERED